MDDHEIRALRPPPWAELEPLIAESEREGFRFLAGCGPSTRPVRSASMGPARCCWGCTRTGRSWPWAG